MFSAASPPAAEERGLLLGVLLSLPARACEGGRRGSPPPPTASCGPGWRRCRESAPKQQQFVTNPLRTDQEYRPTPRAQSTSNRVPATMREAAQMRKQAMRGPILVLWLPVSCCATLKASLLTFLAFHFPTTSMLSTCFRLKIFCLPDILREKPIQQNIK